MTGALDGIRVLDLCIILAGPTCGRTLAEYGAEVIKIDPEHRRPALTPWLDVGRGKRSMCIDIKKDRGIEAFYRLADTADVVLQGFRKGVAERLGVGYEQLSERNPGIVFASINAFGRDGPWSTRPGFDQNAQAATGMQLRYGGSGEPAPPPYTFNDYGTGIMAAYGVMLALLERERTGGGQQVSTSLALTASTFSSPFMVGYDGHELSEVSGPEAKGTGPLSRLYRTSDGWIALSADLDGDWERMTILDPFAALTDPADPAQLEAIFATRPTDEWTSLLREAGVAAVANRSLADIRADVHAWDTGLIASSSHPAFGEIEHGGLAPRLSVTPVKAGTSPVFGGDTSAILSELGYSDAEMDSMRAENVIPHSDGLPLR